MGQPDFQFPYQIDDIFQGIEEEVFGSNARAIIHKLVENNRALENALQAPDERFSLDGPLVTGPSPHSEFRYGGRIFELVGRLAVAGSTDTEIDVLINGNVIGTITISAGDTRGVTYVREIVASRNDAVWVDITTAGTDAERLVVYVRSIPSAK